MSDSAITEIYNILGKLDNQIQALYLGTSFLSGIIMGLDYHGYNLSRFPDGGGRVYFSIWGAAQYDELYCKVIIPMAGSYKLRVEYLKGSGSADNWKVDCISFNPTGDLIWLQYSTLLIPVTSGVEYFYTEAFSVTCACVGEVRMTLQAAAPQGGNLYTIALIKQ